MAKPKPERSNQQTHLLRHLKPGRVYRDTLSGYLVLVQERSPGGKPMGLLWNPVLGNYQWVELYDNMLESAEAPSKLHSRWG